MMEPRDIYALAMGLNPSRYGTFIKAKRPFELRCRRLLRAINRSLQLGEELNVVKVRRAGAPMEWRDGLFAAYRDAPNQWEEV